MPRGDGDDQVPDFSSRQGLQVLANCIDVPAVDVGCGRLDHMPGRTHILGKVFGQRLTFAVCALSFADLTHDGASTGQGGKPCDILDHPAIIKMARNRLS